MAQKDPFSKKVLLLGQEKISWDNIKIRDMTRLHRIRKVFVLTFFTAVTLLFAVFLTGALATGKLDNFRTFIAENVIENLFGIEAGDTNSQETQPQESETEDNNESEKITDEAESDEPNTGESESERGNETLPTEEPMTLEELYRFDPSLVPNGQKAVIPMDLSLYLNGATYINNSTGYSPDAALLLNRKLGTDIKFENLGASDGPKVLIIHTHGTEAYLEDGAISYTDDGSEIARSDNKNKNVVSLGKLMADILNEKGINTVHCSFMHDSVGYRNSYARAEETIKDYLEMYPTIKLVIDVHRDGVTRSTGELIRPVTLAGGEPAAQVMCVVGSDWGGDECPSWEDNLSLALKLRGALNEEYTNLCRPTDLRSSTYNQEFSRYSLLLEIGSCGNSLSEAQRTAVIVAETLAKLIKEI